MRRRGYLVLAGSTLVAGCNEITGGESPNATQTSGATPTQTEDGSPTETPSGTETATETETETDTPTREERAAGAIEDAQDAIGTALDLYLDAANGAETLLDVGPETLAFPADEVAAELDRAAGHLDTASEAARRNQRETVERLRVVTRWLRSAAGIQGAMSGVADHLDRGATAAEESESYETIADHLADAAAATDAVAEARDGFERPYKPSFRATPDLDGDVALRKHDAMSREVVGIANLGREIESTTRAVDLLRDAEAEYADEDYDDAEDLADDAASAAFRLGNGVEELNPDSIQPLVAIFQEALAGIRTQAEALSDDADEQQRL